MKYGVIIRGTTQPATASDAVRPWTDAGATWWIESDWSNFEVEPARRRTEAGPPGSRRT
ncbi:MAG TPA: hypothetical protein VFN14_01565 [Candidatus Limnocylindria bacterium]|nr:hypothetical protein [Candidatus Limnocylindria bacterium]